jgi:hypothetical protein
MKAPVRGDWNEILHLSAALYTNEYTSPRIYPEVADTI